MGDWMLNRNENVALVYGIVSTKVILELSKVYYLWIENSPMVEEYIQAVYAEPCDLYLTIFETHSLEDIMEHIDDHHDWTELLLIGMEPTESVVQLLNEYGVDCVVKAGNGYKFTRCEDSV